MLAGPDRKVSGEDSGKRPFVHRKLRWRLTSTLRTFLSIGTSHGMESMKRVGALDITEAIADRIGSYLDINFMQFFGRRAGPSLVLVHDSGGDGPLLGCCR